MFNDPLQNSVLLVLLIVFTVLAYGFAAYTRGKRATMFGNMRTLERTHGFKRFSFSPIILIVKIVVIALLYLVATDSISLLQQKPSVNTDFVVMLDASSSMANNDFEPTRLHAAKDIATKWVNILPDDTQVGYLSYAAEIVNTEQLSQDKDLVISAIEQTTIQYAQGGTSFDFALNRVADFFIDPDRNKTVLLVTDSADNVTDTTLAKLKDKGITIYAFAIGKPQSDLEFDEEVFDEFGEFYDLFEVNLSTMVELTNATGGATYQIENEDELGEAFTQSTISQVKINVNSAYYIVLLIAFLSIFELLVYAKVGGL